jgi:PTS system mannose-specific IID component
MASNLFSLALTTALVYAVFQLSFYFYGHSFTTRPIVVCPVLGAILGNASLGLKLGAELELIFIGITGIGGTMPSDVFLAGTLVTAYGVGAGITLDQSLVLAVAIGLVAAMFSLMNIVVVSGSYIPVFERLAAKGDWRGYRRMAIIGQFGLIVLPTIVVFLAIYLGADAVQKLMAAIPGFIQAGMGVAAGMMPAVGLALLMNMLWSPKASIYFFFGFGLTVYLKVNMTAMIIVAAFITIVQIYNEMKVRDAVKALGNAEGEADLFGMDAGAAASANAAAAGDSNLEFDKTMFRKTYWGMACAGLCFSMPKMMTHGTCLALVPWLRKIYPDHQRFTEAMVRHQPFFNCTPETAYFIAGLLCSMEREHALDPEHFDAAPISAIKAALMGPLSGVGDAVFWVAIRTIATSVAVSLAQGGSMLSPLVFLIVYHAFSTPTRWFGLKLGYSLGGKFIETAYESGIIDMLTAAATSIGLIMVGAMVATFVNLSTAIVLAGKGSANPTLLQSSLDSIFPKLLPLIVTLVTLAAVRKRVSVALIILTMLTLGVAGVAAGIF